MLRLGGSVVAINDVSKSSVSKGETLEDTMRSLECYSDVIVMRHPEIGSADKASRVLKIPLLSGGDGAGEHPTQALLDMYTIVRECGKLDGLTITMLGDLKHGRTVHSLAKALKKFRVKLNFVSPEFLKMPSNLLDDLRNSHVECVEYSSLHSCLAETDVLYVTRVQKERFSDLDEYERACAGYAITPELLSDFHAKESLRILHPLPRVNEIDVRVDTDERAAYFRQMRYGLFARMAVIALALGKSPI